MTKFTQLGIWGSALLSLVALWQALGDHHSQPLSTACGWAAVGVAAVMLFVLIRPERDPVVKLRAYITKGTKLQARCTTEPEAQVAPAVDKWIKRASKYIAHNISRANAAEFNDDTGLLGFAVPGKNPTQTNITYRMRRLTGLIQKLQTPT